jgi:hypothetical protein
MSFSPRPRVKVVQEDDVEDDEGIDGNFNNPLNF